jgi:molybdopterin-guanine dinucleotide biosynthesis protein A
VITHGDGGSTAGIVLAGGRSSRMGSSKAELEWHGSTLLRHTTAMLARAVGSPVVVVRAPGQALPSLPTEVEVVEDRVSGRGPLQGIAAGLGAVAGRASTAFVAATDMPFLHPAFVRRVLGALGSDVDVVLPVAHGHQQPLAAAYRTDLAARIEQMLMAGRMRPGMLFADVRVLRLDDAELLADPALAAADPDLDSLLNVNEPGDYRRARERPAPEITVRLTGAPARDRLLSVRAATLGAAVIAVGDAAGGLTDVLINGERFAADHALPLLSGDDVTLRCAAV